jgi:two-component system, LytTR family, response regulator
VIKTLIIDDEPIARHVLREALAAFPEIAGVGEAENGKQAFRMIRELRPEVVFLDLQMPGMSGFEVIRNLEPPLPIVVIVTAFDQHAIQAFESGAVDYLLKPVSEERLAKAVERVKNLKGDQNEIAAAVAKIANAAPVELEHGRTRRIVGRIGEEYYLLNADEVLAFQAERELVWIVTAKQRMLGTQSLRAIETRLNSPEFQRVHRNAIVNVNHVRKMSSLTSQRWLITLSNGLQLIVSKRQAHNIRRILQL